ncbi:LOW QUALITY PROTEIN: hypothetical protein PHMEG_00028463, partial [Phytophthora megakarya]
VSKTQARSIGGPPSLVGVRAQVVSGTAITRFSRIPLRHIYYPENLVVTGSIIRQENGFVSIVDTAFARKVGYYIDSSQIQDWVGIGDIVYRTVGRTRIEVTLTGSLVNFFDIWVGDLTGQQGILGMDVMVPARIRLDLAHGSISLPDEVRIQLSGRRQFYSDKAKIVNVGQYFCIQAGESVELPLRLRSSIHDKLWITRGDRWTNGSGSGSPENICHEYQASSRSSLVVILAESGVGSHDRHSIRRNEGQDPARTRGGAIRARNSACNTPETEDQCRKVEASQDQDIPDCLPSDNSPSDKSPSEIRPLDLASVAITVKDALGDLDQVTSDGWATNPSLVETTGVVETQKNAEMELGSPTRIDYIREVRIKEHHRRSAVDLIRHQ